MSGAFDLYETEIARRFNLMTQSISKTLRRISGTAAILIYKQGIINQGGPADIFVRRFVLPDGLDPSVDNPYAFENMACESVNWVYTDGRNPETMSTASAWIQGSTSPGAPLSYATTVRVDACADAFPWDGDTDDFPKVVEWAQTADNLDDQAWENPYDVAKGHRGFIDGDIIMMMYAWSPNWEGELCRQ